MIREEMTDSGQSTLNSTLSGLDWYEGFLLGHGVDAITGDIKGNSPIKQLTLIPASVGNPYYVYTWVKSTEDYQSQFSASAELQYNLGSAKASASSSYSSSVAYSETAQTLLVTYTVDYADYDMPPEGSITLTSAAQDMISDPTSFRSNYGDYVIVGYRRASTFVAMYVCESTSVSDMQDFMAEVSDSTDVVSASGATTFSSAASKYDISISVSVKMFGVLGNPPAEPKSPADISDQLDWFKSNEVGTETYAYLWQYKNLDPSYPNTIPIDPSVFTQLGEFYLALSTVNASYATCPSAYQSTYEAEWNSLNLSVEANSANLATDSTTLQSLVTDCATLQTDLDNVITRQNFYFQAKDKQATEPKTGDEHDPSGEKTYTYGLTKSPDPAVVDVKINYTKYEKDYSSPGHLTHDFTWDADPSLLYVGWEVDCNTSDGGMWKKETSPFIILNNEAKIWASSDYDEKIDFTVYVWSVSAADYMFAPDE